jgi:DNA repair exonuclease SbcCD ATPase subunit
MNDEIKEILDKLKDNNWYEELDLTGTKWIELKQEETNQLLDYITNLQQENDNLKNIISSVKEDFLNANNELTNLQQENERLKTKTKEQSLLLIDYQDMEQKLEDYKSRIEKAVEYIKLRKKICERQENMTGINILVELLNILEGKSDE